MKKVRFGKKKLWILSLTLLSLGVLLLSRLFSSFAEGYSTTAGAAVRFLLGAATALFPFSLFEILLGLFFLYFIFLLGLGIVSLIRWMEKKEKIPYLRFLTPALCILLAVANLFCLGFGPCYFRKSTAENMALDLTTDEEKVFLAFSALSQIINGVADKIPTNEAGESLMPRSLSSVKKEVNAAADSFAANNSFFQKKGFAAKTFLSSPLLTYTHISGVYGFFTGEANVNTNYPHFIITATLAHETCHARGIAPENECNTLAAFLLMESGDPYLTYCGALFLFDDFYSTCKKLDKERANAIYRETNPMVQKDFSAYSRFFDPYRGSTASKVANTTNSAYLQSMGQSAGIQSYSMVIELTCAMLQKQNLI